MILNYLFISVCLVALFGNALCDSEIKEEDGVLVLTKDNFEKALSAHEHILVEFYAPWCGHCKNLAPEYAKAASSLTEKNSEIKLGKVDATLETELAEKHGVKGYPTLKFFRKGTAVDYAGGRKADEIVSWLMKKTGPPAKALASVDDVKTFIDDNNVAIVGFFPSEESGAAQNFFSVARTLTDQQFGIVSDSAIFTEFSAKPESIIMFKKFDEPSMHFEGPHEEEALSKFASTRSLPLIVEFNHETAQKVFSGVIQSHLLLFLSKKAGDFEKYADPLKPIAAKHRDSLLFVVINSDEPDHQRILEFFGMQMSEVPGMRIIRLEEDMSKYKPASADIGTENVGKFVQSYLDGKLKEHLLSQVLPDDWDKNPVKILVASNFDDVVFDKSKDVLIEFYAPWCGHCQQLEPIYAELAQAFKENSDVLIAKMDATSNELEHTKIKSYPTIKLYTKGENKVIEYGGDRTLEGLTKFLKTRGEYGQGVPEEVEEEEEDDDAPRKDEL